MHTIVAALLPDRRLAALLEPIGDLCPGRQAARAMAVRARRHGPARHGGFHSVATCRGDRVVM